MTKRLSTSHLTKPRYKAEAILIIIIIIAIIIIIIIIITYSMEQSPS